MITVFGMKFWEVVKMNKRGISIVVSWVLLIGFTIALAVSIYTWSREQAEQLTEQTVIYVEGKLDCSSVSINVASKEDCSKLNITNKGQLKIEQLVIRIFQDNDLVGDLSEQGLMPFEEVKVATGLVGNNLEVVPVIKVDKKLIGCVDKKIVKGC